MHKNKMSERPLVTVGIPFYNAEKTLADAIRSVFAQTYTNWELILVDDGSTDKSLEIARSIDDPRVRVISDGRNLGLAARLNQIAELAKGKYLARMDSDDLMHYNRFKVQIEYLEGNPSVDIVGTGYYLIDNKSQPIAKIPALTVPCTVKDFFNKRPIKHATIIGRTSWFKHHPYDSSLRRTEDFAQWLKFLNELRFVNLSGYYYYVREHTSIRLYPAIISTLEGSRIIWRYGRACVGFISTCYLVIKRVLWASAFCVACVLNIQRQFTNRRGLALSSKEYHQVITDLKRIKSTPLPISSITMHSNSRILE